MLLERPDNSTPVHPASPPCETCVIGISPGVYLSNLSASDLYVAGSNGGASPAAPLYVPSGQSQPLPWTWHKSHASGPLLALGLSSQGCAEAAQSLHSSAASMSAELKASQAAHMQAPAKASSIVQQAAMRLERPAAKPSLAESFVSFLEGQAGKQSATRSGQQTSARPIKASCGVIDLIGHQGKRTVITLQDNHGQVWPYSFKVSTYASSAQSIRICVLIDTMHEWWSALLSNRGIQSLGE